MSSPSQVPQHHTHIHTQTHALHTLRKHNTYHSDASIHACIHTHLYTLQSYWLPIPHFLLSLPERYRSISVSALLLPPHSDQVSLSVCLAPCALKLAIKRVGRNCRQLKVELFFHCGGDLAYAGSHVRPQRRVHSPSERLVPT